MSMRCMVGLGIVWSKTGSLPISQSVVIMVRLLLSLLDWHPAYEKMRIACETVWWHTGHSASALPHTRFAHSMQKKL